MSIPAFDALWVFWAETAVRGLLVLGGGALAAVALRRRSPAVQHVVWRLTLGALAALPVLTLALPRWSPVAAVVPPFGGRSSAPRAPGRAALTVPSGSARASAVRGARPPGRVAVGRPSTSPDDVGDARWPSWRSLVGVAWLLGVGAVCGALLGTWWRQRTFGRRVREVTDPRTLALAAAAAARVGVRAPVRLVEADAAVVPSTWGLRRPTVLLPAEARDWPDRRLETVLLHELAHVARGDVPAQLVAALACALHWYNPLAWCAARALGRAAERACDDRVLAAGRRPSEYAEDLVALARRLRASTGSRLAPAAALQVVRQSELARRVRAVLAPNGPRGPVSPRAQRSATAAVACLVAPLAALSSAPAPARRAQPGPRAARAADVAGGGRRALRAALVDPGQIAGVARASGRLPATSSPLPAPHGLREDAGAAARPAARARASAAGPAHRPRSTPTGRTGPAPAEAGARSASAVTSTVTPARSVTAAHPDTADAGAARRGVDARLYAVWVSSQQGTNGVPPLVRALAGDEDASVRKMAAWALARAQGAEVVPALRAAVRRDGDRRVREAAFWALQQHGAATGADMLAVGRPDAPFVRSDSRPAPE